MIKYSLCLTPDAQTNILNAALYIANDLSNPIAANRYLETIRDSLDKLLFFPRIHPLLKKEPYKSRGIRKMIAKSTIIYYYIDSKNRKIQVLAVLDARMDQFKQLDKAIIDK